MRRSQQNRCLSACSFSAAALVGCLLLAGCKPVGPNYSKPAFQAPNAYKEAGASAATPPPSPTGGAWSAANPSDGMLRGKWWEIFGDSQLNSLEDQIAASNQNLRQATEIYLAARDQAIAARSSLFPTVSGTVCRQPQRSFHQPARGQLHHHYNDSCWAQASWEPTSGPHPPHH